jgi:short-subunit dehydrogenase
MYKAKPEDGVVWITGASRGIGRATALEMANRGYKVVVTARTESDLRELANSHENINYISADVTNRSSMRALVDLIETIIGPISLAFLNAGGHFMAGADMFGDSFRKSMDLNFYGALNCVEFLLPKMLKRKQGQIVFMSSVSGYGGLPLFNPAYIVSKSATITLAESMKQQLEDRNINVQVVCSGFVSTSLIPRKVIKTPFVVTAEEAAKIIVDGLNSNKFEITFPKFGVFLMKLTNIMPYWLYFLIVKLGIKYVIRKR